MSWDNGMTESEDKRPAGNHVGYFAQGHYAEEMLVYAEDGTLLGKLNTDFLPSRDKNWVGLGLGLEVVREDLVRRLAHEGFDDDLA